MENTTDTIERGALIARRDQIQSNVAEGRRKLKELEAAIQQGVGALILLDELLDPAETPADPIT